MIKIENHIIKGMLRDLSASKFNPEYAFECKNVRITARDYDTLLSVTNERGNTKLAIVNESDNPFSLNGTLLGYCTLNLYTVLFTTANGTDYIYRLELNVNKFIARLLYTGKLNFHVLNPIEALGVYENEDILKVYWVDGRNQARVINIAATDSTRNKWNDLSFDFVLKLKLTETITITRNNTADGLFAPGVIQYAFTYYNKYGLESNIFYTSPIEYISFSSRGASPEDKVSNSFTIDISNADTRFDYVRIYSIHRTSIDGTPDVRNVIDLPINSTSDSHLIYVDSGTTGYSADPTELLYIGGEDVIFKTIALKDNTLFLGNATLNRKLLSSNVVSNLSKGNITYRRRNVGSFAKPTGYYPYKNSLYLGSDIKTFKYLEWSRFGIQFLHTTGRWSEPLWVNDTYNTVSPLYTNGNLSVVEAVYNIPSNVISSVVNQGFIRARGVVVHPTTTDRETVALGILCPTVYNVGDRFSNSPFALASWFSRPNLAFDIDHNLNNWASVSPDIDLTESKTAVVNNHNVTLSVYVNIVNKGAWAEFRHNYSIPDNWKRNAEILSLANVPPNAYTTLKGSELDRYISDHKEYFMVDLNILTFHSPDIEFDTSVLNIDTSSLKMRIVGIAPMTANASDIDIQTSTPQNALDRLGFYKEIIGSENMSILGIKSLISGSFWLDKATNLNQGVGDYTLAFFVYAWHRNGSLNNQGPAVVNDQGVTVTRTAMLDKKKISNLKFSAFTNYFSTPWNAYIEGDTNHTGITPVSIFNSNDLVLTRIPEPANSGLGELNYYGNVDKIIAPTIVDEKYTVTKTLNIGLVTLEFNRKNGYPIVVTGLGTQTNSHRLFVGEPFPLLFIDISSVTNSTDPVRIKYKSTPHAVFALNWTKDMRQVTLPTVMEQNNSLGSWDVNRALNNIDASTHFFWNPRAKKTAGLGNVSDSLYLDIIRQYKVTLTDNLYSFLYLAELYRDNVSNRFGGLTEEAFENNQWLPAGQPVRLISGYDSNGNPTPLSSLSITYTEGDTFLLRYDCLKTYPFTLEDLNSVTDIVSFMCETRVNIDGRYDRNRGQTSNLSMTPENFNKVNEVYTLKNNFFNYRGVNRNKFSLNYFPNTVTWTKEKLIGSVIDSWTNITMASTLDLDGDKGEVTSLNTFNNELFCFLRRGLSNILFNSRVLIPASDGVPIEITNGLKVDGKRYISNRVGCVNKWSIVESPSGIYFIDNEANSLNLFNGLIRSLSSDLGFRLWLGDNNSMFEWDPQRLINFRGFYDKNNDDVYFVNRDWCLCYSELLGQFTSFMSYEGVPAMFNVNSRFFAFKDSNVWEQFRGLYNNFFGEYKPYYVTIVANESGTLDKIFNVVEFRSSSYLGDNILRPDVAFDTLDVYNDYQHGTTTLTNSKGHPSSLKRKFRIWRANVPRANTTINGISGNNRDRIRNPWAYVKLSSMNPNNYRTELFDISVLYTI